MILEELSKSDLLLEIQKFGKTVNPGKKKEELISILKELQNEKGEIAEKTINNDAKELLDAGFKQEPIKKEDAPQSDMDKILAAIGGVATKVESIDKRLRMVENGDANAFKEGAKKEDVEFAETSKHASNVDPRIASIIEKTLGIDFGIEVTGYDDKPGILLTILVPQRLSPVATSYRPIKDKETGEYIVNAKTGQPEEEEYWPGDRRSVAMGANDSFEVVQKHVNRIRSFIMATYAKSNRPQPQFNIKQ